MHVIQNIQKYINKLETQNYISKHDKEKLFYYQA